MTNLHKATYLKMGNTLPTKKGCLYYLSHIVLKHSRESDSEEAADRLIYPPPLTTGQMALLDVHLC